MIHATFAHLPFHSQGQGHDLDVDGGQRGEISGSFGHVGHEADVLGVNVLIFEVVWQHLESFFRGLVLDLGDDLAERHHAASVFENDLSEVVMLDEGRRIGDQNLTNFILHFETD